jgi:hypothetical protein
MISPSALYLTWVSARSCPESKMGLMVALCVGGGAEGGLYGGEAALVNFADSFDIVGCGVRSGLSKFELAPKRGAPASVLAHRTEYDFPSTHHIDSQSLPPFRNTAVESCSGGILSHKCQIVSSSFGLLSR